MKYLRFFRHLWVIAILFAAPAWAQEQGDGTLHVLRPIVHAGQDEGEICLEFDHDLDSADHHRATSGLHLESGTRGLVIASRNVNLDGNLLCLSGLEHRREYRLAVTGLKGTKAEKMAGSYSLTFTVPDRPPFLAFTSDTNTGLMRWQDKDPILRALNVSQVHLELFRVTDPDAMMAAWRQRRQASLAPSESATFARDHGQLVWSGVLDLVGDPNKTMEEKVPLHAAVDDAAPGLYLIVARGPDDKKETDGLAPTSALWLLRSTLKLHAFQDKDGLYALAEKSDATIGMKDVSFIIEDADGQKLAEAKSGDDGTSFLPLAGDKKNQAVHLTGLTSSGDADFTDLAQEDRLVLSTGSDASLKMDRPFYLPAAPVALTLAAHDTSGRPLVDPNASLQLAWPDGNPYANLPAAPDTGGVAHLSFTAPVIDGDWPVVWRSGDGKTLAQGILRVTSNFEAPRLEANADRGLLPSNGEVNLTLRSLTIDGRPFPYLTGRVFVAWMVPDRIFQEWKDYRFGTGARPAGEAEAFSSFLTDGKGEAVLHLSLTPPEDNALIHTATLYMRSGNAEGARDPAPLILPIKPKEDIIGVKPLTPEGRFPENGLARFSVIALDPEGHRKGIDDLAYQIYEEGRSFEWRQEEGRWGYKPLQQNRRLGGGTLNLDANRESIIEWPVTAGTYRLEITDSDGSVRTSFSFSSGWGGGEIKRNLSSLDLKSSAPILQPDQKVEITLNLDGPSMVSAFIGDDRIRKVIYEPRAKGENIISFIPEKDWGSPVTMRIEAYDAGLVGQMALPLRQGEQKAVETPTEESKAPEIFSAELQLPSVLRTGDAAQGVLALKNNGKSGITYRLVASAGIKISDLKEGGMGLAAGQDKNFAFALNALRAGLSTLKLDILPPHLHESREWQISILPDAAQQILAVHQRIEPGQSWPVVVDKARGRAAGDMLFLSPAPLFDAPLLLAGLLKAQPFATTEITGVMEVLRLWQDPLIESGLQTKAGLDSQKEGLLLRLMARQRSDGGFPALPAGPSDFADSAQALIALAHSDQPVAKPALELVANWLRHRLDNTWFDESERPLRAVAYQALAEANKLDPSSLHYFGDTSSSKSLPPLAAAQLALAFAQSGDQAKAAFWLDAARAFGNQADMSTALLPVLAANPFFNPQEAVSIMEKMADKIQDTAAHNIQTATDFLLAVWSVQHRMGPWRLTVNTDKRNPKDILVISPLEKPLPLLLHNTGDGPLYLAGLTQVMATAPAGPVARHIYQLNGTEIGLHAPLERNQTYLIVLEGPWPDKNAGSTEIHDDPLFGLRPMACLPSEPPVDNALAWLKTQSLTPQIACEIWDGGADMLEKREDKETNGWRAAYLAKTEGSGHFVLMPAQARAMEGAAPSLQGTQTRLEIR